MDVSDDARIHINWNVFVLGESDTNQVRHDNLKSAARAIERGNESVAVLGARLGKDFFGRDVRESAVLLCQAGQPKANWTMSYGNRKNVRTRRWGNMTTHD